MSFTNFEVEYHPFGSYVYSNTKTLILGTFPSYRDNLMFHFFYGSKRSNFWRILESVYGTRFQYFNGARAVKERERLLDERNLGIADMHQVCCRSNKSSSDLDIWSLQFLDLFKLLTEHPVIEKIVLTSRTPDGSLGLLKDYFREQGEKPPRVTRRGDKILEGCFKLSGSNISILVPYSPSPRMKRAPFDELVEMYCKCLL